MVGIKLHARVGEKGQIVIPKPIRDQMGIRPETEMAFDVEDEKIVIKKKKDPQTAYEEFISIFKTKLTPPKKISWKEVYRSQFERR